MIEIPYVLKFNKEEKKLVKVVNVEEALVAMEHILGRAKPNRVEGVLLDVIRRA